MKKLLLGFDTESNANHCETHFSGLDKNLDLFMATFGYDPHQLFLIGTGVDGCPTVVEHWMYSRSTPYQVALLWSEATIYAERAANAAKKQSLPELLSNSMALQDIVKKLESNKMPP